VISAKLLRRIKREVLAHSTALPYTLPFYSGSISRPYEVEEVATQTAWYVDGHLLSTWIHRITCRSESHSVIDNAAGCGLIGTTFGIKKCDNTIPATGDADMQLPGLKLLGLTNRVEGAQLQITWTVFAGSAKIRPLY
jgi:hypothetical protein